MKRWSGWGSRSASASAVRVSVLAMAAGYARLTPCLAGGWGKPVELSAACYSDVAVIYQTRAATFPAVPYRNYIFEYPVGTGAFAYAAAAITAGLRGGGVPSNTVVYFTVSAFLLGACGVLAIWFTRMMPQARRGDVLFLAVGLASMGFVNWDLLTVVLTAAAVYAWTRDRPFLCGALLGWGAASKAYPALLMVALLLVCLWERRLRDFAAVGVSAVVAWIVLNAAYIFGPLRAGWTLFYTFSFHRDSDLGTVWNLLAHVLPGHWPGRHLDLAVSVSLTCFILAICVLAILARCPPSLAQLSFLVLAAFLLTSKSWSPQYGLWLLPFAVLTRLPWRVLWPWLAVDLVFYVAGMWYVNGQIRGPGPKIDLTAMLVVVAVHWLALAGVCAAIVRDVLRQPRSVQPLRREVTRGFSEQRSGAVSERATGFA